MDPRFVASGPCWICGSQALQPVHDILFELSIYREQDPELASYTGASVSIRRCTRCGFAQPEGVPALDRYFERLYDQRWSPAWLEAELSSPAKTGIFDRILAGLERRLPPRRRSLLDVGAHVGAFAMRATRRGWQVEGVEVNPTTAAFARARSGAFVHAGPLEAVAAGRRSYDAVTLTDVLEHVPRPLDLLREAASRLRDDGWIAVKVPCGPNQLRKERVRVLAGRAARVSVADNLVHVSHFSPRALAAALERAGFRDIALDVGAPERVTGGGPRAGLSNAVRAAAFHAARASGAAYSPLAFNLQAYARRTGSP